MKRLLHIFDNPEERVKRIEKGIVDAKEIIDQVCSSGHIALFMGVDVVGVRCRFANSCQLLLSRSLANWWEAHKVMSTPLRTH